VALITTKLDSKNCEAHFGIPLFFTVKTCSVRKNSVSEWQLTWSSEEHRSRWNVKAIAVIIATIIVTVAGVLSLECGVCGVESEFGAREESRMRVGPVGTFLCQERYFYGQA